MNLSRVWARCRDCEWPLAVRRSASRARRPRRAMWVGTRRRHLLEGTIRAVRSARAGDSVARRRERRPAAVVLLVREQRWGSVRGAGRSDRAAWSPGSPWSSADSPDLASSQAGRTGVSKSTRDSVFAWAGRWRTWGERSRTAACAGSWHQQASRRIRGFALAYVGMAFVHSFLADAYVPPNDAYPRAKAAAQAALAPRQPARRCPNRALVAYATFAGEWGDPAGRNGDVSRLASLFCVDS